MLEIFLVIAISNKIAAMLKAKGRSSAGYIVLFIFLWIAGEIVGAVAGTILTVVQNPNAGDGGFNLMAYFFALVGAAVGGTIGYVIASAVPPVDDPRRRALEEFDAYEDDEYDVRSRDRRRRRDTGDGSFEEDR